MLDEFIGRLRIRLESIQRSFSIARLLAAIIAFALSLTAQAQIIEGKVVGINDGDTITVLDPTRTQHKIRLAGIDAPEKRQAFGNHSLDPEETFDLPKADGHINATSRIFIQPQRAWSAACRLRHVG